MRRIITQLHPQTGTLIHVAAVNPNVVYPTDATNVAAIRWEMAGTIDAGKPFGTRNIFLVNVQAHENGSIASRSLVEGGQMFFLTYVPK